MRLPGQKNNSANKTYRWCGRTVAFGLALALLVPVTMRAADECLECHSADKAVAAKAPIADVAMLAGSVHGSLACNDCHNVDSKRKHIGKLKVYCESCHREALEGFAKSPHVEGKAATTEGLPTCIICHGQHDILAIDDPKATTSHANSARICIGCHEDEHLKEQHDIMPDPAMIRAYETSIHGKALLIEGNMDAPSCINCHGTHSFMPSDNPESPIFKTHIAATCGQCHEEISTHYQESVHGTMLGEGVLESPTCTNCHGEHDIKQHLDPESHTFAANIPVTCNNCHSSEAIVGKFGLKADRISTFKESFHGVAIELGEMRAANCASCHGVHDIFPQSDPRSMVHPSNIQSTCGECHEDLPEDFAQGTFHASASDEASGGSFWVRKFYYWFIPIVILLFVFYRVMEYKRRVRRVE